MSAGVELIPLETYSDDLRDSPPQQQAHIISMSHTSTKGILFFALELVVVHMWYVGERSQFHWRFAKLFLGLTTSFVISWFGTKLRQRKYSIEFSQLHSTVNIRKYICLGAWSSQFFKCGTYICGIVVRVPSAARHPAPSRHPGSKTNKDLPRAAAAERTDAAARMLRGVILAIGFPYGS